MGRKSRKRWERRRAREAEVRREAPTRRYPVNTEYERSTTPVTPSEGYLRSVCDRTFLSLWSYPNPFGEPGKELCDLLVVFDNDIIIFSDKHCDFPESTNLDLDWSRWYRRAIEKAAHQSWGAERWIRRHPDKVFLDAQCKKPFPLRLAITERTRFHRVVIAHGAASRCLRELGGSGSLMLSSALVGSHHTLPQSDGGLPFMVGQVDSTKGFVHILDDTTFGILLNTLDTVADLVGYLAKKERFFKSGGFLAAAGEEELLAYYLTHLNTDDEYDFVFDKDVNAITLDEGFWRDFVKSPQRKSQLEANKVSYLWDDLIERFTRHFLQGTSHHLSGTTLSSQETLLRFFAREPRVRRRMLASAVVDIVRTTPPGMRRLRVVKPSRTGDPYFVLLALPRTAERPHDEYRLVRQNFLEASCQVVKLDFPDAMDIVGFATEAGESDGRSEDALYFDARHWSEEMAARARHDKKVLES